MFGLAAERNQDGTVTVVSPKDGIEFKVDETVLSIHMINLGDFCRIGVKKNQPTTFVKHTDGIPNVQVSVEKGLAKVSGVRGTLREKLAMFYRTEEFGNVACQDKEPGKVGMNHSIIVSRLPEDERVGIFSKFVWGAVRDENASTQKQERKGKNERQNQKMVKKSCENASPTGSEKETTRKRIIGLVTFINLKHSIAYATCNLTYPGTDVLVHMNKNEKLKTGDWIEMKFSTEDFKKYFPFSPTIQTPRASTNDFKTFSGPSGYCLKSTNNGVEVAIDELQLENGHEKGSDIIDRYLGIISDATKIAPAGGRIQNVVLTRDHPKKGVKQVWKLKDAKKVPNSNESSDTEQESSSEIRGKGETKEVPKTKQNEHTIKSKPYFEYSECSTLPQYESFFGSPIPYSSHFPPMIFPPPTMQHFNSPACATQSLSLNSVNNNTIKLANNGIVGQGFQTQNSRVSSEDETKRGREVKRAVVTSLKPNTSKFMPKKDTIAFLWLLDDHVSSAFYISSSDQIQVGHFFQGIFKGSDSKWNCEKYLKPLGKLLNGTINNDIIELHVLVNEYFPPSGDRIMAETFHPFIGRIVDQNKKLPSDCSGGLKIAIKLYYVVEKSQWAWVVHRTFQSKYIQTLQDFYEAWKTPGVRKLISEKCYPMFNSLRILFDATSESAFDTFIDEETARNTHSSTNSTADDEEGEELTTYAWTTMQDKEFIRMMIFPRKEGESMNQLKKNVSDKAIYKSVEKMTANRLYRVNLDEKGEVVKISDCPQYISLNEDGNFEFKFITSKELLISKNTAVVTSIGLPESFGKLLFVWIGTPIPKNKYLMKASFRFLDDEDSFANHDIIQENSVCFISVGDVEMLENQDLDFVSKTEKASRVRSEDRLQDNFFENKMSSMSKDEIFAKYKEVAKVLKAKEIVDLLTQNGVFTENLANLA